MLDSVSICAYCLWSIRDRNNLIAGARGGGGVHVFIFLKYVDAPPARSCDLEHIYVYRVALNMSIVLRVCVCGVVWTESAFLHIYVDGIRCFYSTTRMRFYIYM